ncbi:MAG TPA: type II toxin-antitoxin system RelE/ParE family toxin [Solirubrobacteraceae bacterium]|nr:type II toxin-antitoxin system RelE/ParE family toxin [Solirubrobacteraceae bacterium]
MAGTPGTRRTQDRGRGGPSPRRVAQTAADLPLDGWRVLLTPEAREWFEGLSSRDADKIAKVFEKLEEGGPGLRRPHVGLIRGSRHHNMKEVRSVGGHIRALVAFDPRQRAVVLLGGDKTNDWRGWYRRNIRVADKLYDRHLRGNGETHAWTTRDWRAGGRSAERDR